MTRDRHPIADEDIGVNESTERPFWQIAAARLSRRGLLKGVAATAAVAVVGDTLTGAAARAQSGSTLTFSEVAPGPQPDHAVAPGYKAQVVIRWGDKVLPDAPAFNVRQQSAAAQGQQFGYNCDFIAYAPLPVGLEHLGSRPALGQSRIYRAPHDVPGGQPENHGRDRDQGDGGRRARRARRLGHRDAQERRHAGRSSRAAATPGASSS